MPIRSDGNRQRGAALIETALTLAIVLNVIFWTIELCMLVYTKTVLAEAVNEGVRYGITHSGQDANIATVVTNYAYCSLQPLANVSSLAPKVAYIADPKATGASGLCPGNELCDPPNHIQVSVSYKYTPFVFSSASVTLNASAEGSAVYTAGGGKVPVGCAP